MRARRFWFHWQNLNDKPGGRQGMGARNGRAWLHFGERGVIGWQWVFFSRSLGISLGAEASDGTGIKASLCLGVVGLYVHAHGGPFAWLAEKILPWYETEYQGSKLRIYKDRDISFQIYDWGLQWTIWKDWREGWKRGDPRWRDGSLRPLDMILGSAVYSSREISEAQDVVVPMPEGGYPATCKIVEVQHKRPRWFPRRFIRAEIEIKKVDGKWTGVPFPGKGENSYDCGEDATSSMSCAATTPEAAIGKFVESTLGSRRRHGGSVMWKPAPKPTQDTSA